MGRRSRRGLFAPQLPALRPATCGSDEAPACAGFPDPSPALRPSRGGPVLVPDGQALGSAREQSASGHANHPREPLSAPDRPDPGGPSRAETQPI